MVPLRPEQGSRRGDAGIRSTGENGRITPDRAVATDARRMGILATSGPVEYDHRPRLDE